ncbi:SDR family NAD(P)-dependent oxidoreductase [Seohaeicola zhoushanensis]|uniref:Short-chain dehydrogenase n=1 Tax=Seohaeicola zhoushanensis TaxID=1569283 RepID=A0A8J3GWW4_9RHOB|nr:SDR family NAD(P)-dependent oxidoreductase [Seohaeicola zhoushanensis]GHF46235.1 short-chain dehydrogenase [Seohaeicola zhoushanensis]
MKRVEGRTALVTGAAEGLGKAIAARLASEGARVVVTDRDPAAIERAQAELPHVTFHQVDMMDESSLATALGGLIDEGFAFDILVNNAGGSLHTPRDFFEETEEDWARVMGLNVTAAVRTMRAVLPGMVQRRYGRVINLGSKAGRYGSLFTGCNYVAAKGAMQSMTLQLAQEFGPHGITCNAVCPGAIHTPRVISLLNQRMSAEEQQAVLDSIPVRRAGRVEDVAAAVLFFAADEAGFVTGQLLDVNGGQGMAS